MATQRSFARAVEALATMFMQGVGGGAPVLDLDGGAVAGTTFGAQPFEGSYAVPSWRLREDPRIRELGVRFTATTTEAPLDPVVEEAWQRLDAPAGEEQEE